MERKRLGVCSYYSSLPEFLKYFIERKKDKLGLRKGPVTLARTCPVCCRKTTPTTRPHPPKPRPLPPLPQPAHLANSGLLVAQAHDEDAVRLPNAALGPGRERAVRLVEHNPMDVLLLPQPAGQPVLVDTGRHRHPVVFRGQAGAP